MEWYESANHQQVLAVVFIALAAIAAVLFAVAVGVERWKYRSLRRYVETQGGTVLSIRSTIRLTPDVYVGVDGVERQPWKLDSGTPRYQVRWRDSRGGEHDALFVTHANRWAQRFARPVVEGPEARAQRRARRIVVGWALFVAFVVAVDAGYIYYTGRPPTFEELVTTVIMVIFVTIMIVLFSL